MGGHQVPGRGSGDDGYDEDGFDESQRAEILEATRDGPNNGTMLTDLNPDLGEEIDETEEDDELLMVADEVGEESDVRADAGDDAEDDAQQAFDAGTAPDAMLSDDEAVALKP
ncbi:DNA primase [Sphingomonas sp.]|uniref:DNA primase n=1 Tax=Sphingomonas sp. TaxID=28214 RepID=UPI001ED27E03|nr:DNA primase [Sphingomonas sp.]MBX3595878.1 DNA primase [Sphingomonas sp.]